MPLLCAHGVQAINLSIKDLKGVSQYEYSISETHLAAFALVMLGAFTLAANAQSAVARATVPFEFAAGGAMLPPGEYTVDVSDLSGVIVIHGPAGSSVALLTTFSEAVSPPPVPPS